MVFELSLSGERHHADVPEGQPGAVIRLFVCLDQKTDNRIYSYQDCIQSRTIFWVIKSDFLFSISDFSFLREDKFMV